MQQNTNKPKHRQIAAKKQKKGFLSITPGAVNKCQMTNKRQVLDIFYLYLELVGLTFI